jgi:hypothetical protein
MTDVSGLLTSYISHSMNLKNKLFLIIRTRRNITVYLASNFLNKKKFQDGVLDKGGTRKNIDFDL